MGRVEQEADHWAALPAPVSRQALEDAIAAALAPGPDSAGEDGLITRISRDAVQSGGKRLRPALVLLAGEAGPRGATASLSFAAACEILHNATLIHDDVIDGASLRRGKPTVAAQWGTRVAVLAGDYLFARALTLVTQLGIGEVSVRLGRAVELICEAELDQIQRAYALDCSEAEYVELVRRKSALLIAECCRSGAVLGGAPPPVVDALYAYGEALGIAFQITDDILDLVAAERKVGKPTGGDIRLGLLTLPVLRTLQLTPELIPIIERRMAAAGDHDRALAIVRAGDGVPYARTRAGEFVARAVEALAVLPPGQPRQALERLARLTVCREY